MRERELFSWWFTERQALLVKAHTAMGPAKLTEETESALVDSTPYWMDPVSIKFKFWCLAMHTALLIIVLLFSVNFVWELMESPFQISSFGNPS